MKETATGVPAGVAFAWSSRYPGGSGVCTVGL